MLDQWFVGILKEAGQCRVAICNATECVHNENRQCMLAEVTIANDGGCEQFKVSK